MNEKLKLWVQIVFMEGLETQTEKLKVEGLKQNIWTIQDQKWTTYESSDTKIRLKQKNVWGKQCFTNWIRIVIQMKLTPVLEIDTSSHIPVFRSL